MTRLMIMTFLSEKRWREDVHPHESPRVMTWPLIGLAALSAVGGILLLGDWIVDWLEPVVGHAEHHELAVPAIVLTLIITAVVAVGVAAAVVFYRREPIAGETPADSSVSLFARAGRHELYGNELNDALVVRPTTHLTRLLVWFDGKGIDGFVTGTADRLGDTSQLLRKPQTGYVRSYALMMFAGVAIVVVCLLAVTLA
jgi:NADH-quinone oxidoreductase subunit L